MPTFSVWQKIKHGLHSRLILIMLLPLHFSVLMLIQTHNSPLMRALFVSHVGLFLLWQPVWNQNTRLNWLDSLKIIGGSLIAAWFLNAGLLIIWLAILIPMIAGLLFSLQTRTQRLLQVTVILYLLLVVFAILLPYSLQLNQTSYLVFLQYGMTGFFSILWFFPYTTKINKTEQNPIDFILGMLFFLLLGLILLGSLATYKTVTDNYYIALSLCTAGVASILLVFSWLWNPVAGFSGLSAILSGYALNFGTPFERWTGKLAQLAAQTHSAEVFLEQAAQDLNQIPWIQGGRWHADHVNGVFGHPQGKHVSFYHPALQLTIFTHSALTPALRMQFNLLTQLLGEFYLAKQREITLQDQAYIQAIYETGARLTHDVKNILQALKGLCSAAEYDDDPSALIMLIQRQLPQIAQRLELTLDKLKTPERQSMRLITATDWWDMIQQRYPQKCITFIQNISQEEEMEENIPQELFDTVLDNLLQNALEKQQLEPNLEIIVRIEYQQNIQFFVSDTGTGIPETIQNKLFKQAVQSSKGMGVGLYQQAQQAQQYGYVLSLVSAKLGNVCFRLQKTTQ